MYRHLIDECTAGDPVAVDRQFVKSYRYRTMMSAGTQHVAFLQEHVGIISLTKFASTLDNRLENRHDVGRRGCDHPEDITAPGLIGQCLGKVACLRLNLFKQANIFDGNDGLVCEGGGKLDVSLVERLHFFAGNQKQTDHDALADEGNAQHTADTGSALERTKGVFWIAFCIIDW